MKLTKKAQIMDQLGGLAIGIVSLTLILVITFLILAQGRTQVIAVDGQNTTAYNATESLQRAVDTIPGWVPLIVIAVIGAGLLGLVALFRNR